MLLSASSQNAKTCILLHIITLTKLYYRSSNCACWNYTQLARPNVAVWLLMRHDARHAGTGTDNR